MTNDLRQRIINKTRIEAGLEFCVKTYGHDRVMVIDPWSIDAEHPKKCFAAQVAGANYEVMTTLNELSEKQQVEYGFIGERQTALPEGSSETKDLTPLWRETVMLYRAKHKPARPALVHPRQHVFA